MNSPHDALTPDQIADQVLMTFPGVYEKKAYGERTFFYNPGMKLPNGVYFLTIKEADGPNDQASQLNRPGVYHMAWNLPPQEYEKHFGPKPKRPPKGEVVNLEYDFTQIGCLLPHPVYAWMSWVMWLSPTEADFNSCRPLIEMSYQGAIKKFEKKKPHAQTT